MSDEDEQQIRDLVHRWAEAVHRGDLAGVLRDHGEDIVMFDVPPPYRGVIGLDAYRRSWPEFFAWQRTGASFEIETWTSSPAPTSPSPTAYCAAVPPTTASPTPSNASA